MTFGKKTLFSLLLVLDLLANVLELTHSNFFFISTLVSFCTCLLLPGFLLLLILQIRKISFWEYLLFVVGLSLAFLEFGGLLLNILLPLFGVNDPLAFQNLVIGFDVYTLLLFIFAWIRTKQIVVQLSFLEFSKGEKALYTLPVFFPILAALGAIVLNNGGSNILTLILLAAIACYGLLLVILRDKVPTSLYLYAIFFMALASLFTTSLRSWYITGHDIEREFYVFQLTNMNHLWNMAFFQDAYNACLSITILPTILTNLLSVPDMYVYKVIFQILFAVSPVLVFLILRNYTAPVFAFLSAFLFISFPTFFNDMPMLNRQEIGFIFFGLALYVMLKRDQNRQFYTRRDAPRSSELSKVDTLPLRTLSSELSKVDTLLHPGITKFDPFTHAEIPLLMRRVLFIIFGLSVIVSHYSTNFVLLALVVFIYLSTLIISQRFVKNIFTSLFSKFRSKSKNIITNKNKVFLSLPLVLILFGATYFWNTLYTNTSDHTSSVIGEVIASLVVKSNTDARSSDLSYSIFLAPKSDPVQQLQDYVNRIRQSENTNGASNLYSESLASKYPSYPIPQEELAPTPLGILLSSLHVPVFNVQAELRSLSAYFMQIFVFIGLLATLLLKNRKPLDLQYLLLCLGSIALLALITVLPALSVEYGVLRMFQQLLFMLSLPIVLGLSSMFFFVKERRRAIFIGIITISLFLNLTGFISHLTGDYYPQMTLDNSGLYYDAYFVHGSDIQAIVWLSKNDTNHTSVEADLSGVNKLLTYGNISALSENFPALLPRDAYVYLEVSSNTVVSIEHSVLIYNSDRRFLDDNKNLIYSNGTDNVYK